MNHKPNQAVVDINFVCKYNNPISSKNLYMRKNGSIQTILVTSLIYIKNMSKPNYSTISLFIDLSEYRGTVFNGAITNICPTVFIFREMIKIDKKPTR